jgi:competence protein ComEA
MIKKSACDNTAGIIFLLFILSVLSFLKNTLAFCPSDKMLNHGKVFVQISGEVKHPGVYLFSQPPDQQAVISRAGGLSFETENVRFNAELCHSGSSCYVEKTANESPRVLRDEMPAFYKVTLGIPIDLNSASVHGLTAISGIGPKTAQNIVHERLKRGGFIKLDDLLDVKGIGPSLYKKIYPYLQVGL